MNLQSASSENANIVWRYEKPTAADYKSAFKRSSLFKQRIANPLERLADSRSSITLNELAYLLNA